MRDISLLYVDGDPVFQQMLGKKLRQRNYYVRAALSHGQALSHIEQQTPDMVMIDPHLPNFTEEQAFSWISEHTFQFPIMVMSNCNEEEFKVQVLDSGATDYITKPFKFEEFLARLRAIMRRNKSLLTKTTEIIKIEGLIVDPKFRRAYVDNTATFLTATEFALLETLAQNRDAVLTHNELLAKVRGSEYFGSNHYLHVYLGRLRKKLGSKYDPLLETVPGVGYLFHSSL